MKRFSNDFIEIDDYFEIHFKNGQIGFIDKDDYNAINQFYWGVNSQGYAHSRVNNKLIRLHLYILNFPENKVDHINRNKLDNRKSNLRLCTHSENTKNLSIKKNNTSGFPGVSFHKSAGKWRARIMLDGKEIFLGNYKNIDDAIDARKAGELKYFGEFAPNIDDKFRELIEKEMDPDGKKTEQVQQETEGN